MKKIILFSLFMQSSLLYATPQKIEMIFLSPNKKAALFQLLDQYKKIKMAAYTAQTDEKCVPMGDGCFHPQLGYIEKKPEAPRVQVEQAPNEVKTFNSLETSLVNCDKGNHFDIFCGKESDEKKKFAQTEVWIDTSSSLREVDYGKDGSSCARRTFMNEVQSACKGNVNFSVYNTALKEVGDHSSACLNYGTNDEKRLVKWIKESSAKTLLIVTDIDELSPEMRALLEENGAKMIGDGTTAFTTSNLIEYAKEFSKHCN